MTLIPYGRQWIDEADAESVRRVLSSDYLTQGPEVGRFERAIMKLTGAKFCVAVSSGTAALHLAVASLGIEEGKGKHVPTLYKLKDKSITR